MVTRQVSIWLLLFSCGGSDGGSVRPTGLSLLFEGPTTGKVDTPMEILVRAVDGTAPYFWSRMGGVSGMILEDMGGREAMYRGTPDQPGLFSVSINAEDANRQIGTVILSFQIAPHQAPPRFSRETLPIGVVDKFYRADLALSGGEPPLTWAIDGVPPGLNVDQEGRAITGRSEIAGDFVIDIRVTDYEQRTAQAMFMLKVVEKLEIATSTLPPARVGQPYQAALSASGGSPPYNWTAALPAWLSLTDGVLTGTPDEAVSAGFSVELTDGSAQYANRYLIIDVGS